MALILGVAKALKAMHQYTKKSGSGSARKARAVRQQAHDEDEDAAEQASRSKRKGKGKGRAMNDDDDDAQEHEPLMDDEVTQSQDGVKEGERRAYAHRDIKPGEQRFRLIKHLRAN